MLIENLIQDALDWDKKENRNKSKGQQKIPVFQIYKQPFDHVVSHLTYGRKLMLMGKGLANMISLVCWAQTKKKLLRELPGKLNGVIEAETVEVVKNLWEKFGELYSTVTCTEPSTEMRNDYFSKAKEWVNLFISLRDKRIGYKRANVTPYMHAMVYHIPRFLEDYQTIKLFTGQGVEKNNDMARAIVLRKSNNWDAPTDILRLESRQWELRESERSKRSYTKKNSSYWEEDLRETRKNKGQKNN